MPPYKYYVLLILPICDYVFLYNALVKSAKDLLV